MSKWLQDSGRVGVWRGNVRGGRVRGKSGANGGNRQAERAGEGVESRADGLIGVDGGFGISSEFSKCSGTKIG